jgi:hypothetical protein
MAFSQRTHEGYLIVDHRNSPGIKCDNPDLGEGKVYEVPTLGCRHCHGVQVINPKRTRERGFCFVCNRYVCDLCYALMHKSGYVHRTFMEVADMVHSGKFVITGGTSINPILTRKESVHG